MHPKNPFSERYDFKRLIKDLPELKPHVIQHPKSGETIDFSNPESVTLLNRALLKSSYQLNWDLPSEFLTPGVPGRADYLYSIFDLIKVKGKKVRLLDVGCGANLIYSLIAARTFDWSVVGCDIDPHALGHAQKLIEQNKLSAHIELRQQQHHEQIFKGVIKSAEEFTLTVCNPPFYGSHKEAEAEANRKWKHLGLKVEGRNFGGRGAELYCKGGELVFLKTMVKESAVFKNQVQWFSSLVSNSGNVKILDREIDKAGASELHTLELVQGQKKTRVLAWTFR